MSYSVSSTDQGLPEVKIQTETGYYHSQGTAVINPLLQSIISGALVAILTVTACLYFGWPRAWETGALMMAISQCIIWGLSIVRWSKSVSKLENLLGVDLNRDHVIGDRPEPVRVELLQDEGRSMTYIDLPARQEQLIELASGLLKQTPMAYESWTGAGGAFSRAEFTAIRNEMLRRGLLDWINPHSHKQGLGLTAQGRAVMRYFASQSSHVRDHPPTPASYDDVD